MDSREPRWTWGEVYASLVLFAGVLLVARSLLPQPELGPPKGAGILRPGQGMHGLTMGSKRQLVPEILAPMGFVLFEARRGGRCLTSVHSETEIVEIYYNRNARSTVCIVSVDDAIAQIEWMTTSSPDF